MNNSKDRYKKEEKFDFSVDQLAKAIFVINKHAKAATEPKFLYSLKKNAIEKLLSEGKAKKLGLHFSKNPKFSRQTSTVLISCGEYLFHLPPSKEDFQSLPHLGELDDQQRNPKAQISLNQAKALLIAYTGMKAPQPTNPHTDRASKQYISPFAKRFGER
ncbi:MAG TPA: YkyB family protein [Ureibacillus sp.]|nr:YkyB family protein [Ureibacillus sp.]